MKFVAIDVETANADLASICQIGIARCENSVITDEWKSYVNPEDYFDDVNVSIHSIDKSAVQDSPTFPELVDILSLYLEGYVVVCHSHFDRVAIHRAAQRYQVSLPQSVWLDSAQVARRTWPECAWKGYGLYDVCKLIGYDFKHHDALEDAKAAAMIFIAAINESKMDIESWFKRVRQPINLSSASSDSIIRREGNPDGTLNGEVLVFTGMLELPRREAADLAATLGCQVASGVTKQTTILVVGDQDTKRLAGHEKSSKHRKAEELINKGNPIRILRESDFKELAKLTSAIAK